MKIVGRMFSSLALALALSSMGAQPASAQTLTGKFILPFEAHWGTAILEPGEYNFQLDHMAATGKILLMRGQTKVAQIITQGMDKAEIGRDSLYVTRSSGIASIRELRVKDSNLVFRYAPTLPKRGSAVEERASAWEIPLRVSRTQ